MRLSLQVYYAICGVFDLAYNGRGRPVQVRVTSQRQEIPARYLEQIFQRLRSAGFVIGKRGPGGGYRLARPPRDITLLSLVEALEGPLDLGGAGQVPAGESPDGKLCHRPEFLWPELAQRFSSVLAETTVENLCRRATAEAVRRAGED